MTIWAHRGASAYAPENTLAAFRMAVEMKADGIELDVHLSRDGVLMVGHDEAIDRCSNGTGLICEMSCEELKAFDYSYHFPEFAGETMPTLREVYQLIAPTGLRVNVELKTNRYEYEGIERKCAEMAEEFGMTQRVLYSSFNPASLERMHAVDPDIPTAILYDGVRPEINEYARNSFWKAIHPEYVDMYRENAVRQLHELGRLVHVWTVDDVENARKLIDLGVDGIITNRPDLIRDVWEGRA